MSVYHYVANKDEIVDAIVDLVYSEIELPIPGGDWQADGAASYVFGFALSENALPIHGPDSVADTAASMMERFFDAEAHPALFEFTTEHVMRRLRLRTGIRVRAHRHPARPCPGARR